MNKEQIDFIRSLDPDGIDGTIQVFLAHNKLNEVPFEFVAKKIMQQLVNDKRSLVLDNVRLSHLVKEYDDDWK